MRPMMKLLSPVVPRLAWLLDAAAVPCLRMVRGDKTVYGEDPDCVKATQIHRFRSFWVPTLSLLFPCGVEPV